MDQLCPYYLDVQGEQQRLQVSLRHLPSQVMLTFLTSQRQSTSCLMKQSCNVSYHRAAYVSEACLLVLLGIDECKFALRVSVLCAGLG